jgi:pimeloyl-ACP methyl ester carboxylesterase
MIDPVEGGPRDLDRGRQIRFVGTPSGGRVAYATVGRGPALVVPAGWIGHLEVGWQDPAMRAFYAPITAWRTVVAYDKPGCGLSDPWPAPQTLDSDLEVLGAVADHLELEQIDLLGLSMGAPVSLAYAARHPRRVGRLILFGSGSTTCWTAWPRPRWCCTDATTGPSPTAWAAIWRPGSRGRGWCRWPAAATFPISATPRPWSGRSWGSWAHPHPSGLATSPGADRPSSPPASSRSRPWSPAA